MSNLFKIVSYRYFLEQLFRQHLPQFLLFVTLILANGIQAVKKSPRMINGEQATHGQFPMVAALLTDASDIVCEGTLLTMKVVLTAGHCYTGLQQPGYCVAGLIDLDIARINREFVRKIRTIQVHPMFLVSIEFDLALARLDRPYEVGPHIKAAKLANEDIGFGEECYLPGWESDGGKKKLLFRKIKVLNKTNCGFGPTTVVFAGYGDNGSCTFERAYSLRYSTLKIVNKTSCGFGETTIVFAGMDGKYECGARDSGGPLVCGDNQILYASLTEKMTALQSYCPFSAIMTSRKWIIDNLRGSLDLANESAKMTTGSIVWRLYELFLFAIAIAKLCHRKASFRISV